MSSAQTYVSFTGIPLSISFEWPYHHSQSGSDGQILHGELKLQDGSGRKALIAVQMSKVIAEMLPSLEPRDAESPSINTVRKFVDTKDIEFLQSGKRQPIILSSRQFSVLSKKWEFQRVDDEQLADFLKRKIFWTAKLTCDKVFIADAVEAQYLGTTTEKLIDASRKLASEGLIILNGEFATAAPALQEQATQMEAVMQHALHELEAKHEFEKSEVKF
jgi:hypothetical protein